ncbi:hypothetical protein [Marinilabilia rubra]|uniref:HEAT repeat domain-containing protein n=1 Tax=Marinilabilia rubra TaxID=2162893 RepID=A0A2U2BCA4_9BACT|nr:hypothetical protein [Marinilabilia rubra]PWE00667.1 hypothetical protein DDZ16_03470 [Marinilabilia rubra]
MKWKYRLNNMFDENSKDFLIQYLIQKPEEIESLIKIMKVEEKTAWRAAWVLDHLNQNKPLLLKPHLKEINTILKATEYNGVRRSLLKILITNPCAKNDDGDLLDLCFQWIASPSVPIAIRAHSMQFIVNLLPAYPELKNEFQLSLETAIHDESKGVSGKARRILSSL